VKRIAVPLVVLTGVLVPLSGCVQSRYGITYERRIGALQTLEVVLLRCQVDRIHTGGVLEPQPELSRQMRGQLARELRRLAKRKGFRVPSALPAESFPDRPLAFAVAESILAHHYVYGRARTFDYTLGHGVRSLQATSSDAILYFILKSMIPTEGRKSLKATATVIGIATGAPAYVPANQTTLMLMLVEARTGDVLWTSVSTGEIDITVPDQLRKLVEKAGQTLRESPAN
jgi:hypothetical protein